MSNSWAREESVKAINKVLRKGAYSNIELKRTLEASDLNRVDKALVTEIVNGTLRNLIRIDWIISQFAKQKKISPWIEDILRSGIYQILFLDRVPDSAICNESVELARKLGHEGTVKFVNGVLRNIIRSKDNIPYPDKVKDPINYLSVMYSHPEWIVKKWIEDYGVPFTEALLQANNEVPPFTIRVNGLKTNKAQLEKILVEEEMELEEALYIDEALYIRGTSSIEEKKSFKQGLYQIQDESSMLVARVVDPLPGEIVMDVCSAPGGKTTHMADRMKNQGTIIARDIHAHKLKLIQESCKRLGVTIVKAEKFDAKILDEKSIGTADRVLIDAPCSGLGVLRRKPDLRWKKTPEDFTALAALQKDILDAACQYVKKQGVLVYSTCTTNKSENIDVINTFLQTHENFILEDISGLLPLSIQLETAQNGYIEIYPNTYKTDGFFIARMKRI